MIAWHQCHFAVKAAVHLEPSIQIFQCIEVWMAGHRNRLEAGLLIVCVLELLRKVLRALPAVCFKTIFF